MLDKYKLWFANQHKNTEETVDGVVIVDVIPRFIKFVTKHKLSLSITIVTISVLIAVFNVIPVVSINKLELVNLGASVTLQDGQIAKLKTQDVSVKILHFTNEVCSEAGKCFGGDTKAVEYELNVNGVKYATGSMAKPINSPYQITTVSSDYKTYAIIQLVKSAK